MYGSNNVEFMGVLVDRQYTSGQRCAQLVFETAEGIRLSLSRNINMARSLRLGLTYKVKGPEHTVGQKRYVHEPTATLVPAHKSRSLFRNYKILIPATIGLVVILGGAGTLAYAAYSANSQPVASEQKPAAKSAPEVAAPASTATTSQPTSETESPAPAQPQTRAGSSTTTKKATSTTAKTATTSKSVAAPVTSSTPSVPIVQEDTTPVQPVEQVPEETPQTPVEQPESEPIVAP